MQKSMMSEERKAGESLYSSVTYIVNNIDDSSDDVELRRVSFDQFGNLVVPTTGKLAEDPFEFIFRCQANELNNHG